ISAYTEANLTINNTRINLTGGDAIYASTISNVTLQNVFATITGGGGLWNINTADYVAFNNVTANCTGGAALCVYNAAAVLHNFTIDNSMINSSGTALSITNNVAVRNSSLFSPTGISTSLGYNGSNVYVIDSNLTAVTIDAYSTGAESYGFNYTFTNTSLA